MSIRIADLPEDDRPRERLWRKGVAALSNAELIALVLRQGRAGESALDLAARLLVEHGGLDRLALARAEELAALPGVGPTKAAALVAAFQLSRNLGGDLLPDTVRRPDDLAAIAQQELAGLRRERVLVLVLDAGNRVQRVVALAAPIVGLRFLDHLIVTDSAWLNLTPRQRE